MIILGLTTSSARGGVALLSSGEVRVNLHYFEPRGHGERLFASLEQGFREAGIARRELRAIGCDVGPGSFTGLRVALSAAKGIALALSVPLVGVGSLEAMAAALFELRPDAQRVVAFVDAHKGEVFALTVDRGVAVVEPPLALSPDAARAHAEQAAAAGTLVVGDVVEQFAPGIAVRGHAVDLPDASVIARVASQRLAIDTPEALRTGALPIYGREPDAKPNPALLDSRPDVGSSGRNRD
jgi:tRNA threonylcarbamoyladenosine biosynthesis protein TsaB